MLFPTGFIDPAIDAHAGVSEPPLALLLRYLAHAHRAHASHARGGGSSSNGGSGRGAAGGGRSSAGARGTASSAAGPQCAETDELLAGLLGPSLDAGPLEYEDRSALLRDADTVAVSG